MNIAYRFVPIEMQFPFCPSKSTIIQSRGKPNAASFAPKQFNKAFTSLLIYCNEEPPIDQWRNGWPIDRSTGVFNLRDRHHFPVCIEHILYAAINVHPLLNVHNDEERRQRRRLPIYLLVKQLLTRRLCLVLSEVPQ